MLTVEKYTWLRLNVFANGRRLTGAEESLDQPECRQALHAGEAAKNWFARYSRLGRFRGLHPRMQRLSVVPATRPKPYEDGVVELLVVGIGEFVSRSLLSQPNVRERLGSPASGDWFGRRAGFGIYRELHRPPPKRVNFIVSATRPKSRGALFNQRVCSTVVRFSKRAYSIRRSRRVGLRGIPDLVSIEGCATRHPNKRMKFVVSATRPRRIQSPFMSALSSLDVRVTMYALARARKTRVSWLWNLPSGVRPSSCQPWWIREVNPQFGLIEFGFEGHWVQELQAELYYELPLLQAKVVDCQLERL